MICFTQLEACLHLLSIKLISYMCIYIRCLWNYFTHASLPSLSIKTDFTHVCTSTCTVYKTDFTQVIIIIIMGTYNAQPVQALSAIHILCMYIFWQQRFNAHNTSHTHTHTHTHTHSHTFKSQGNRNEEKFFEKSFQGRFKELTQVAWHWQTETVSWFQIVRAW